MTSTNDEKDVKSNQTSGHKSKLYYIELYTSLEKALSGEGSLEERTTHVCEAWRRVYSLYQHSSTSTHPHLLSWLQRHTANTVLQSKWDKSKNEHARLKEAIDALVAEATAAAANRKQHPWEKLLLQRAAWFRKAVDNPWDNEVLKNLINPNSEPVTDQQVIEWLISEHGVVLVTRLQRLVSAGNCDDLALLLASAVMDRARAGLTKDDHDDVEEENHKSFVGVLEREASFTTEEWDMLTDIELVLLLKTDKRARCIELAKLTPLRHGYKVVERLRKRLEMSPRDKKLWKHAKEVATLVAQVIIARCMVLPSCSGAGRDALYWCARSLARLVAGAALRSVSTALAAPAATARHLHTFCTALSAECKELKTDVIMKTFICELYVRAITAGMNELEQLKLQAEKESEARLYEQTLAGWFTQLGGRLTNSARLRAECALTAFSVHPARKHYERVASTPVPPRLHTIQEPTPETTSEYGSWANDSRTQSNLVKTSETLQLKQSQQHQANVLSTAILTEGETLGLEPELCQDLAVLLSGPRVKTLSWDMDREVLLENCRAYMDKTHGGTRAVTTELKFLNLDPDAYRHLPEEGDDESDLYYGIEKGYEHEVQLEEPEDIWQNAFFDPEQTESANDSEVERQTKKKSKALSSEDDEDPLSNIAEAKREKKLAKEKRKEQKKTKSEKRDDSKDRSRERRKDKDKKTKKESKKDKSEQSSTGSLTSLLGMKVTKMSAQVQDGEKRVRKKKERRREVPKTMFSYVSVTDNDYDCKEKCSQEQDPNVLVDGVFSMDELRSPERKLSVDSQKALDNTKTTIKHSESVKIPVINDIKNKPITSPVVSTTASDDSDASRAKSPYLTPNQLGHKHVISTKTKSRLNELLRFRRKKPQVKVVRPPMSHTSTITHNVTRPPPSFTPPMTHNTTYPPPSYTPKATHNVARPNPSHTPTVTHNVARPPPSHTPKTQSLVGMKIYNPEEIPKVYLNKKQCKQLESLSKDLNDLFSDQSSSSTTYYSETEADKLQSPQNIRSVQKINSPQQYNNPMRRPQHLFNDSQKLDYTQHSPIKSPLQIPNQSPNVVVEMNYPSPIKAQELVRSQALNLTPPKPVITYQPFHKSMQNLSTAVKPDPPKKPQLINDPNYFSQQHLKTSQLSPRIISNTCIKPPSPIHTSTQQYTSKSDVIKSPQTINLQGTNTSRMPAQKTSSQMTNYNAEPIKCGHKYLSSSLQNISKVSERHIPIPTDMLHGRANPKLYSVRQQSSESNKSQAHTSSSTASRCIPIENQRFDTKTKPETNTDFEEYVKELVKSISNGHDKNVAIALNKEVKITTGQTLSKLVKNTPPQCAKQLIQQKKSENAPNTFSRLSYMHKNKQSESKVSLTDSVTLELNKTIMEHKLSKAKCMKNEVTISRVAANTQDAGNVIRKVEQPSSRIQKKCPLLSSMLDSPSKMQAPATTTSHTASETQVNREDADLLLLLRNQTILNSNIANVSTPTGVTSTQTSNSPQYKVDPHVSSVNQTLVGTKVHNINILDSCSPEKKESETLEWRRVMDAIIAQKTEPLGPNALDLALKKDYGRHSQSSRGHSSEKPKIPGQSSSHIKTTDPKKREHHSSKANPGTRKPSAEKHSEAPKKSKPPTKTPTTEVMNRLDVHSKHLSLNTSKTVAQAPAIPNSDYDNLDDLLDDDLRRELGEISSDEDSYITSNASFPKVRTHSIPKAVMKAANICKEKPHIGNPKTLVCKKETNLSTVENDRKFNVNTGFPNVITNPSHPVAAHRENKTTVSPQAARPLPSATIAHVSATTLITNKVAQNTANNIVTNHIAQNTASNIVTNHVAQNTANNIVTNHIEANHFVRSIIPANVIIASGPPPPVVVIRQDLVYDPYPTIRIQDSQVNTDLCAINQNVYALSAAPNIAVYQTTQFAAPVINPVIIGNAMTTTNVSSATAMGNDHIAPNSVNQDVNKDDDRISLETALKLTDMDAEDNQTQDTSKILDFNMNRNCERKVLSQVQEKQTNDNVDKDSVVAKTVDDSPFQTKEDEERIKSKRESLMNRKINHAGSHPPIVLTYTPIDKRVNLEKRFQQELPKNGTVKPNIKSIPDCTNEIEKYVAVNTDIKSPQSEVNNENVESTNEASTAKENQKCRRIWLRSSNKIRTKTSPVKRPRVPLKRNIIKLKESEKVANVKSENKDILKNSTRVSSRKLNKFKLITPLDPEKTNEISESNELIDFEEALSGSIVLKNSTIKLTEKELECNIAKDDKEPEIETLCDTVDKQHDSDCVENTKLEPKVVIEKLKSKVDNQIIIKRSSIKASVKEVKVVAVKNLKRAIVRNKITTRKRLAVTDIAAALNKVAAETDPETSTSTAFSSQIVLGKTNKLVSSPIGDQKANVKTTKIDSLQADNHSKPINTENKMVKETSAANVLLTTDKSNKLNPEANDQEETKANKPTVVDNQKLTKTLVADTQPAIDETKKEKSVIIDDENVSTQSKTSLSIEESEKLKPPTDQGGDEVDDQQMIEQTIVTTSGIRGDDTSNTIKSTVILPLDLDESNKLKPKISEQSLIKRTESTSEIISVQKKPETNYLNCTTISSELDESNQLKPKISEQSLIKRTESTSEIISVQKKPETNSLNCTTISSELDESNQLKPKISEQSLIKRTESTPEIISVQKKPETNSLNCTTISSELGVNKNLAETQKNRTFINNETRNSINETVEKKSNPEQQCKPNKSVTLRSNNKTNVETTVKSQPCEIITTTNVPVIPNNCEEIIDISEGNDLTTTTHIDKLINKSPSSDLQDESILNVDCENQDQRVHSQKNESSDASTTSSEENIKRSNLSNAENKKEHSYMKGDIKIEELPLQDNKDPFKKLVRIILPNNKVFRATIHGKIQGDFDSLFAQPTMRSILSGGLNDGKRYTVNYKQVSKADKKDPSKILGSQIQDLNIKETGRPPTPVDTVNLISDDEDEVPNFTRSFATEFGQYNINIDQETFAMHQKKFNQKCEVKMHRSDIFKSNKTKPKRNKPFVKSSFLTRNQTKQLPNAPPTTNIIPEVVSNTDITTPKLEKTIPSLELVNSNPVVDKPNVIEIDDSSNDSIGNQTPKLVENATEPAKKIVELANLLLQDLGVPTNNVSFPLQKEKAVGNLKSALLQDLGLATTENSVIDITEDDEKEVENSTEIQKLTMPCIDVTGLSQEDVKDNKILPELQEQTQLQKCVVKLVKCDSLIRNYKLRKAMMECYVKIERLTEKVSETGTIPSLEEKPNKITKTNNAETDNISEDSAEDYIEFDVDEPSGSPKLSRCPSLSILNNWDDDSLPSPGSASRSSPVMEIYDVIAQLRNKLNPELVNEGENLVSFTCDAEWTMKKVGYHIQETAFRSLDITTKNKMNQRDDDNMTVRDTEEQVITFNPPKLLSIVLNFIENTPDVIYRLKYLHAEKTLSNKLKRKTDKVVLNTDGSKLLKLGTIALNTLNYCITKLDDINFPNPEQNLCIQSDAVNIKIERRNHAICHKDVTTTVENIEHNCEIAASICTTNVENGILNESKTDQIAPCENSNEYPRPAINMTHINRVTNSLEETALIADSNMTLTKNKIEEECAEIITNTRISQLEKHETDMCLHNNEEYPSPSTNITYDDDDSFSEETILIANPNISPTNNNPEDRNFKSQESPCRQAEKSETESYSVTKDGRVSPTIELALINEKTNKKFDEKMTMVDPDINATHKEIDEKIDLESQDCHELYPENSQTDQNAHYENDQQTLNAIISVPQMIEESIKCFEQSEVINDDDSFSEETILIANPNISPTNNNPEVKNNKSQESPCRQAEKSETESYSVTKHGRVSPTIELALINEKTNTNFDETMTMVDPDINATHKEIDEKIDLESQDCHELYPENSQTDQNAHNENDQQTLNAIISVPQIIEESIKCFEQPEVINDAISKESQESDVIDVSLTVEQSTACSPNDNDSVDKQLTADGKEISPSQVSNGTEICDANSVNDSEGLIATEISHNDNDQLDEIIIDEFPNEVYEVEIVDTHIGDGIDVALLDEKSQEPITNVDSSQVNDDLKSPIFIDSKKIIFNYHDYTKQPKKKDATSHSKNHHTPTNFSEVNSNEICALKSNPECKYELIQEDDMLTVKISNKKEKEDIESKTVFVGPNDAEEETLVLPALCANDADDDIDIKGYEFEDMYVFPLNQSASTSTASNDSSLQEINSESVNDTVKDDIHDIDYHVIEPVITYSRKRKSTWDIRIPAKKYRKGKNIDCSKQTAISMAELAYAKEYKRLLDYCSSVKFSYTRPFHKECVELDDLMGHWPIDSVSWGIPDNVGKDHLFVDLEHKHSYQPDPATQTFVEEISYKYDRTDASQENLSSEASEVNFNMGFGEGSGRVIQILKNGESNIAAATLSDVKQAQPVLKSVELEDFNDVTKNRDDQIKKIRQYVTFIELRDKIKRFFKNSTLELKSDWMHKTKDIDDEIPSEEFPYGLCSLDYIKPPLTDTTVQVVQVGQLPVSAAAQNPVTCDPRVTQVSDASPSQCSVDNSPNDDSQSEIKTEYTELTTADLTLPLQEYAQQNQANLASQNSNVELTEQTISLEMEIKAEETPEIKMEMPDMEEKSNSSEHELHTLTNAKPENVDYSFDKNTDKSAGNSVTYDSSQQNNSFGQQRQQNGTTEKTDQIAHAMNAAGITTTPEAVSNTRAHALVNILSQKIRQGSVNTTQTTTNTYSKTTSINAMALQQALAQILPPPLNQTGSSEKNQGQSAPVGPQVLHIVQGKNASGNQITLLDNSQQSVISTPNATQVLHIVQNKNATPGQASNGTLTPQANSFSGLSLVDAGLQQGGNQLLHIVNTGNQKTGSPGQLLKRVNLLTNLTNVQGSNEQKMVQFVCKSADGKAIQLNAPHQRSMVLRLQPIETPNVQTPSAKAVESQELSPSPTGSASGKESAQEIKSRSIYEENYAKFIQNSSSKTPGLEKSTSLPKFNQAFGKPVFQEGTQKQGEPANNNSHMPPVNTNTESTECSANDNSLNLEHIGQISSPPLLLRKQPVVTTQSQPNIVQQIKQTIAPMNIQTMHGGVIYTRQIPVNIGGGQTINLITVPSTELINDDASKTQNQSNQGEIEPSIIKIVPQSQTTTNTESPQEDNNNHASGSTENTPTPQPQPVLTQMRIKLPMLSKAPQMVPGARVVRPSFFQIQRNVIGGANQPVYQQLVLTAAPPLGQQTIRLPAAQASRPVKAPSESQSSSSESQMSTSTLEQLREFDMVLEQVKERSTVQPSTNSNNSSFKIHTTSSDTTDGNASSNCSTESTSQVLYSIGNNQALNVAYVNRKTAVTTPTTSTYVRSPDSSGIADSPTSSVQISHTVTSDSSPTEMSSQSKPAKIGSKSKSRPKSTSNPPNTLKLNSVPPKTSSQKPLEDEQTTQRILYILAEYKEQVENSPDKDKPAPRRRSNPPSNPGSSKRKKSSSSRRSGTRDMSPVHGEDTCRTMGSEDSSCGTSQGDCTESCLDSHSPQDSPRKVARKITFDQELSVTQPRPQPQRNVIVADGQTITVARGTTGKPATAVLMPANYILPVSMVKGGQQIAIVTNRGPKLLTVGGEGGATNALLLQRLIGPAGLKPVLARPGVRHVRLPTAALHNLQAFNLATATTVQPPDSTASPTPGPTPPELVDTRANSSPWTDRDEVKPERGSSPEGSEPWNLPSSADPHEYTYEETVRTDNMDRTVLVVQKKDGSQRQHRLSHVSAAALRHKYAILEHELRLQKSLSEECEDLGVDSPSASELFPEAELLFAASPAHEHNQEHHSHTPQPLQSSIPQPDMDDQIATDHLIPREIDGLGLGDVGIVAVSEDGSATIALDQEEFARSHPNTTFHSEPTEGEVQPFTITGLKGRHITSTIFHSNSAPATVLMTAPQATVISQAPDHGAKYEIENMINSMPSSHNNDINLSSVLVKDDGLTRFDNILTDSRELHLTNTTSAIVHSSGNATQVIRRVCYEDDKRERDARYLIDEPDNLIAGDDAKMIAEDSSRDATLESMADVDDDRSSPERHAELFWESNSASERSESRRPLDFSSDSDKCCKSPSFDETNSTDSSGVGAHMRLDSVIKEARGRERSGSADGSSADDAPPPRTYPPKRMYPLEPGAERSLSGKTRAGERSPDGHEVRRRASGRGVVKRGCHCCNGEPAPSRPKKPRQRKPTLDFNAGT